LEKFTYKIGNINYKRDNRIVVVDYYYPSNVEWSCIQCGSCCGDIKQRTRMILLLPDDIKRIEKNKKKGFYMEWCEGNFIGLMCKKKNGKCVFYSQGKCTIYKNRALLCKMYPFWLEKKGEFFVFGISEDCPGIKEGDLLREAFFSKLLQMALRAMDY
jgi:Fe-S-cluster containining protein